jgi:hypothetical protein
VEEYRLKNTFSPSLMLANEHHQLHACFLPILESQMCELLQQEELIVKKSKLSHGGPNSITSTAQVQ